MTKTQKKIFDRVMLLADQNYAELTNYEADRIRIRSVKAMAAAIIQVFDELAQGRNGDGDLK